MPMSNPCDDDRPDDDLPDAAALSHDTAPGLLVPADEEPRDTLARLLTAFIAAFGTDAGDHMDRVLA
jgi:hypothetical protein